MEMRTIETNYSTFEITVDAYDTLEAEFLKLWNPDGDFDPADWHFEGRFCFHHWVYEKLFTGCDDC